MSSIQGKIISFSSILIIFCLSSFGYGILQDPTTLLFEHCSTRKLDDPNGKYTNARSELIQQLVHQSSWSKFNKSVIVVVNGNANPASLSGLFQCRGDLDDHKCIECMKAIQKTSSGLCGHSMAARIQLTGCHVQYEANGYDSLGPADQLKYKNCGEPQGTDIVSNPYFEQTRSQIFEALESEVGDEAHDGNNGFYSINHEGFNVIAQCEVGIGGCQCGRCVVDAVHVAEEECKGSLYGQVYMDSCYLTFVYDSHGTHGGGGDAAGGGGVRGGGANSYPAKIAIGNSGKVVAITVGGAAFLGFAFLFFHFLKKKNGGDW